MDSGVHFKQADSWVSYTTELAADGYISFLVNASSHYDIGPSVASEFFIDNVPQPLHDLIAHTYSFPVSAVTHTFLWLHHQDQESLHGDIRTVVSQIRIMGASSGGYVAYDCPAGYASSGGRNPCTICPAGTYSPNTKSTQCLECPAGTFTNSPGSSFCLSCGAGTSPNKVKGATSCVTSCVFSVDLMDSETSTIMGNYTFNLTDFKSIAPLVVQYETKKFTAGVCDKLTTSQSPCKSTSAFVCEDDSFLHESFEAGNLLSFLPNAPDPNYQNVAAGFMIEYSMGSAVGCPKTRKTYLHFSCKMGATPYLIQFMEDSNRHCEYHISVITEYACPMCNDFDLVKVTGACEVSGERTIQYEPIVPCRGVPDTQREKCSGVEINEWVIVISVGFAVVMAITLVGLTLHFWKKKTQTEQKYALLVQETTAPVELQDFDDLDDDDEQSSQGLASYERQ